MTSVTLGNVVYYTRIYIPEACKCRINVVKKDYMSGNVLVRKYPF